MGIFGSATWRWRGGEHGQSARKWAYPKTLTLTLTLTLITLTLTLTLTLMPNSVLFQNQIIRCLTPCHSLAIHLCSLYQPSLPPSHTYTSKVVGTFLTAVTAIEFLVSIHWSFTPFF